MRVKPKHSFELRRPCIRAVVNWHACAWLHGLPSRRLLFQERVLSPILGRSGDFRLPLDLSWAIRGFSWASFLGGAKRLQEDARQQQTAPIQRQESPRRGVFFGIRFWILFGTPLSESLLDASSQQIGFPLGCVSKT